AEHARARGARVYGRLAGYGITSDAYHITGSHPDGLGQINAMHRAMHKAELEPADIGHVNAHATSTSVGDIGESHSVRQALGTDAVVTAPKGSLGHLVGGAGAVESIMTILSLNNGVIPATTNLKTIDSQVEVDVVADNPRQVEQTAAINNAFGFGGHNVALAFTRS